MRRRSQPLMPASPRNLQAATRVACGSLSVLTFQLSGYSGTEAIVNFIK